jgi:hypothetical protein
MPLYWVAAEVAGEAAMTQATQQTIAAALAAAGWVIAAGIAWWYGSQEPQAAVSVSIEWDPDPSWQCAGHPNGGCYSQDWGCTFGS